MGNQERRAAIASVDAKKGIIKLMLRIPLVRKELKNTQNEALLALAEAYQDASSTLEQIAISGQYKEDILDEYKLICTEIEMEVLSYCKKHRADR
ncbi:hypothetical protein WH297_15335 [Ochrobactrum vermis]|uniref:Uncharacterized protein n=1 Tax=Ochrobactrum vermis TaxID=1827297 RepID=A0ABU8PFT5_9HYPH|nr:hypothetical protein [Ochrobactrum vermis]PQZ25501.1 hypothetical protein CQZ93_15600 [Ochrobactrum vermis]